MMTFNDTLIMLKNLFTMNAYRIEKCRKLFKLAQQANGPIVELGSYQGMSTIALDWGSGKNQVYAVDNWNNTGWIGEEYTEQDYEKFKRNIRAAQCNIIIKNQDISKPDKIPSEVSLIFWDTGVENCLLDHFSIWSHHLKKGGLFLVHDTADCRLGWQQLENQLRKKDRDDWRVEEYCPLHALRRL